MPLSTRTRTTRSRPALPLLAAVLLLSCGDAITDPSEPFAAELMVTASVIGTPVATLVIEVSAPDVSPALVFNLVVEEGFATGMLRLPPGTARTISAQAFDAEGVVTHEGAKTVDIAPGQNPPVSLPMYSRGGQQPITITLGEVSIVIQPASVSLAPNETVTLAAEIRASDGDIVDETPVWATTNPSVATVQDGIVTAVRSGEANIVATFGGVAAVAHVTVVPHVEIVSLTISAGRSHSCGLDTNGVAYCWGSNSVGQLGDGTTTNRRTPVAVSTTETFVVISARNAYTVALTSAGHAFGWGLNADGQLGDGTVTNRSTPVAVSTAETFVAIAAGRTHTVALTSAGKAFAWGDNDTGQLGDGTTTNRSMPVAVSTAETFAAITVGGRFTAALTPGGHAFAWGSNLDGKLGTNTFQLVQSTPAPVSTDSTFIAISASPNHTVALTAGGHAFAWGQNFLGQLGDGTTESRTTPVPVSTTETFAAISAGKSHTVALTSAGKAFAWGSNDDGPLGDGTQLNRWTPVAVLTTRIFVAISAGGEHTLALAPGGAAFGWGNSSSGQLGNGTTGIRTTPVAVSGGITFAH